MKGMLLIASLAVGMSAFADDAPHWIGLDTTVRDQLAWVAPVTVASTGSLDTRVSDFWASFCATIYGTPVTGMFLLLK